MADKAMPHYLLEITPEMTQEEILRVLQVNAIRVHQTSVGRGDELITLLERAVQQMETTHTRVRNMSTIFFAFGLLTLAAGVYIALFGPEGAGGWGAILGGGGGLASAVAIFFTTPLDKISASITNLIQLETAFLGYIRVVGEIDSAFQWQYIERIGGRSDVDLRQVSLTTMETMQSMMSHTMKLIDQYIVGESKSLQKLSDELDALAEKVAKLSKSKSDG